MTTIPTHPQPGIFETTANAEAVVDLLNQEAWTPADTLARVDALIAERKSARSAAARKGAETKRRNRAKRGTA